MGSIYFPRPAWRWWHGCHWLLLSHMGLHYNGASESKSPRRRRPVCLADRLWCKRLVIGCYSKQHNRLVKDEWRQIGLRMFRLRRACFHGVHPWNEHVCSNTSGRSRKGQCHRPAQKGTEVEKKQAIQRLYGGTAVCGRSGQVISLSWLASVLLPTHTFVHSFPPCLLSLSLAVVLACLVNLRRSPWIFRLTWLTSGVCSIGNSFFFFFFPSLLDGCSWELIRAFAFVGVSRSV